MIPFADHIIGVDGGGSTCRVAIALADGTVIGGASGAAANPATSLQQATACLRETLDAARRDAGLAEADVAAATTYMGLAGVISGTIAEKVAAAMHMPHVTVTDDRPTNMVGALGTEDGFIAALGTGSFFGRQTPDTRRFIGGWGFWLGDQASGAWLGRLLLSRVLEWRDGMHTASPLLEQTFADFGEDPARIVLFAHKATPHDFGKLAPSVLKAAKTGDSAGLAIVHDGCGHVQDSLDVLGFRPGDPLCLTGGIGPFMADHLAPGYTANLTEPRGTALDGALRLAARIAAKEVT